MISSQKVKWFEKVDVTGDRGGIVSIESSYHSWNLYTTGQLVDGLQQKKKTGIH